MGKNRDDRIRKDSARSYCDTHCLQLKVLLRAVEVRSHLAGMLKRFAPKGTPFASCGDDDVTVRKCLISGYFANAAKLASTGDYLTVRGNTSVSIHTHSVIARYVRTYNINLILTILSSVIITEFHCTVVIKSYYTFPLNILNLTVPNVIVIRHMF